MNSWNTISCYPISPKHTLLPSNPYPQLFRFLHHDPSKQQRHPDQHPYYSNLPGFPMTRSEKKQFPLSRGPGACLGRMLSTNADFDAKPFVELLADAVAWPDERPSHLLRILRSIPTRNQLTTRGYAILVLVIRSEACLGKV